MPLIVTRSGQTARVIKPTEFPKERFLQDHVVSNPQVLPFDELRENLRLAIVAKELPTSSGPIDAVGVEPSYQHACTAIHSRIRAFSSRG